MKKVFHSSPRALAIARVEKLERSAFITLLSVVLLLALATNLLVPQTAASAPAPLTTPFLYTFNSDGTLQETDGSADTASPYFWLQSGAILAISNGTGSTNLGTLPADSPWRSVYAKQLPVATDNGTHPQNVFRMFTKGTVANPSAQIYLNRLRMNLANSANRHPYNAESLIVRYQNDGNFYLGSIRADGHATIKKKTGGTYQTLVSKKIFEGTYDAATNPDVLPRNVWTGLKFEVTQNSSGNPLLSVYTDVGRTGSWKLAVSVVDDPVKFGTTITAPGLVGIQSDFTDVQFDNLLIASTGTTSVPPPAPAPQPAPTSTPIGLPIQPETYDAAVLADQPVLYLTMGSPSSGSEQDKSGNGNSGTYKGGAPVATKLPNGDTAAVFNGTGQYLTVASAPELSIPTTKKLTWEAWIRPDTLQFARSSGGYVDWMGKCANYSPTCEWEARMYNLSNPQNRSSRLSAYVFNPTAGLGSGADWQPAPGVIAAGEWIHVVAEYDTSTTPSACNSAYPGSINIWVNGVKQNAAEHYPTGCMSQFKIVPRAGNSPLNIGTMALDTFFKGAIGKVAVYNRLLTQSEIAEHYKAMSGKDVSGSCGDTCRVP